MNEREKTLLRLALVYAIANLDDIREAFQEEDGILDFNGQSIRSPTEDELNQLALTLQ